MEYCNQRWVAYTGLTVADTQDDGWTRCLHPDDVDPAVQAWREAKAHGTPYEVEQRVRGPDGRYRRFLSRVVPLYDEQGQLLQWFGTYTDLEERKQAEEALGKAQAELAHATRVMTLGELAASIAHEVNQPLTAVINNSNACLRWLARRSPDLEGVRGALRDIIANGQRASDVIARIRAALKKDPMQTERLEINHIIAEMIELMYHEVQRYGAQLHTELASDLPAVSGDHVQLQQVLLNLVVNGIEAMSPVMERPRQLLIRSSRAGPEGVLVAVQDSGIGLDPHTLERIFDPFFTTKAEGMGMGLSICRTIIKAHGGRLWAECNPGPGATLQFILPRATENRDG
jgi:PAS domain S-box-containing protein